MAAIGSVRERKRGHQITYFVDLRPHGRVWGYPVQRGRALPITSEADARRLLERIRADISRDKSVERALAPWLARAGPKLLVRYKAERWLEHLQRQVDAGERSPTYLVEVKRYVTHDGYGAEFWDGRIVMGINYGELEDWNTWMATKGGADGKGIGPATRAKVLGAFKTMLRWLHRRGEITSDDIPQFPIVEVPEHSPAILNQDEQAAVIAEIPWELRGGFLAARLGMRPNEVRAADIPSYAETQGDQGWITVARAQKGDYTYSPIRETKEKNVRAIPCDDELRDWIRWRISKFTKEDALAGRVALFPNWNSRNKYKRWAGEAMRGLWNRTCAKVGFCAPLYEGTKHSTGTHLRESGVSLDAIQELFGHADRRSTERYGKLRSPALAKLIRLNARRLS